MDLISRQELIDNLNRFAPEHFNALINNLIMKQPTAQRWILVTERLPEKDGDYLVTVKGKEQIHPNSTPQLMIAPFFGDEWTLLTYDVLAWMPLPKPYRGGEE